METIEAITGGAEALTSYGFNAICAVLVFVVFHLYRRLNTLELEFRNSLVRHGEEMTKANVELKELVENTNAIINSNSKVLERVTQELDRRD